MANADNERLNGLSEQERYELARAWLGRQSAAIEMICQFIRSRTVGYATESNEALDDSDTREHSRAAGEYYSSRDAARDILPSLYGMTDRDLGRLTSSMNLRDTYADYELAARQAEQQQSRN